LTIGVRSLGDVMRLSVDVADVTPAGEYAIAGVYSFGRGLFKRRPIAATETSYTKLHRLHVGQLVVSRLKAFEGALAVVPPELDGWFLSPEFPTFECIEGRLHPAYLAHVCRWPDLWSMLAGASRGIGARRERVHVEDLLRLELAIPLIDDQRRVADELDQMTAKEGVLSQSRQRAEQLRTSLTESRVDRRFSEINARALPIQDLGVVRGGIQKSSDRMPGANPVRYLTVAHVGRDEISFDDARYFEVSPAELERRSLEAGDVLIIEGNGSVEQIGRAALFRGADEPFVHQNHVIRVRPSTQLIEPDFLNLYLNSPPGRRAVQAQARTSSGLRSLSVGRIKQILVPVPSIDEQRESVTAIRALQSRDAELAQLTSRSRHLAAALVPAALNRAFAGLR